MRTVRQWTTENVIEASGIEQKAAVGLESSQDIQEVLDRGGVKTRQEAKEARQNNLAVGLLKALSNKVRKHRIGQRILASCLSDWGRPGRACGGW